MVEKYPCRIEQLEIFPRLQIFSHIQISRLSRIFEIHKYQKEDYVYKEGQPSDFFAVILTGKVLLQKDGKNIFKSEGDSCIGKRHSFGYDTFSEYPRNLTIKVVEDTELLVLPNSKRIKLDRDHPITAMKFYKLLLSYNSLQLRFISGILEKENL